MFDTHAHYDDEKFEEDREKVLYSAHEKGVQNIINIGCDLKSSRKSIELANKFDFVYAVVGIHPQNLNGIPENVLDEIREMIKTNKKVVGIGEIGLDYHYDFSPRDVQLKWFERQLAMSKEFNLPIIIHEREASRDCLELIKKYAPYPNSGVLHCFSGSWEIAKIYFDMGFYIGIDGPVTFKNAIKTVEIVEKMPIERLLVETDSPYLSPEPLRGKRNDSENLKYIIQKIADIRNVSFEEVRRITSENAKKFFRL